MRFPYGREDTRAGKPSQPFLGSFAPLGAPDTLHGPARKRPADLAAQEIRDALALSNGNKTQAAQALGIAVNTLKARMRQLGMESPPRSGKR